MKLSNEQDAFGHAVWDHYHGTNAFEVIERSDGLVAVASGPSRYLAGVTHFFVCRHHRANGIVRASPLSRPRR